MSSIPVPPLVREFRYYPADRLEIISHTYFVEELTRYTVAASRWRPCINGASSIANPLVGCICTRVVGGLNIPLREFAYIAEHTAGFVDTPEARECVLCMIAAVKTRMMPHNRAIMACDETTHTIQPFQVPPAPVPPRSRLTALSQVDIADWPPGSVLVPSNIRGAYNGLSAPFPRLDLLMLCSIDNMGFFRIGIRSDDTTPMSLHAILTVLLPLHEHAVLAMPVDCLDTRCAAISSLMLAYRRMPAQRLATFYLAVYLDTHMAQYRALHGIAAGPEAPSQLTLHNYIGDSDIVAHTPATPMAAVTARSLRLFLGLRFNIPNRPHDANCIAMVRDCVCVSVLGNYLHSRFINPMLALSIADRIALLDTGFSAMMRAPFVDVAIAEYGVSLIQNYPTSGVIIAWPTFVATMKANADALLRGSPNATITKFTTDRKLAPLAAPPAASVRVVACAFLTGTLSAYMCTHCDALSAYVDNRQRGLKRMSIAVDPFAEFVPDAPVVCNACGCNAVLANLHGRMLLYSSGYILTVCPSCNFLAAHRDSLRSTICNKCTARSIVSRAVKDKYTVCYVDKRRIVAAISLQLVIYKSSATVAQLPVCAYHHREHIVVL